MAEAEERQRRQRNFEKWAALYLEDRITPNQEHALYNLIQLDAFSIPKTVIERLKKGARQDKPLHQALLGLIQFFRRPRKAYALFKRSHELGCIKGTYWTAVCHLHWTLPSAPRDQTKALCLIRQGLQLNPSHPRMLWLLGNCYMCGYGGKLDLHKAARCYRRSASLGLSESERLLKRMAREQMDPGLVVPYGEWRPSYHCWTPTAIEQQMIQALMLLRRLGVSRDVAIAHLLPFICTRD